MKKTLLLLTVLTFSITSAQEKENDATWDETIGFIEKYKEKLHFDKYLNSFGRSIVSRDEETNRKYNKVARFENQIESKKVFACQHVLQ